MTVTQITPSPSLFSITSVLVVLLHGGAWTWWHFLGVSDSTSQKINVNIELFLPPPPLITTSPSPISNPSLPAKPKPLPILEPLPTPAESVVSQSQQEPKDASSLVDHGPLTPPTEDIRKPTQPNQANTDVGYLAPELHNPKPPYPLSAVRQGAEGRVVVWAEVLPNGHAGLVRLEQSSGHAVLDASAMNTVRSWRFTPALSNGVPISQSVRIPIDFTLQNSR